MERRKVILVGLLGSLFEREEPKIHFGIFKGLKVKFLEFLRQSGVVVLEFFLKNEHYSMRYFQRFKIQSLMHLRHSNKHLMVCLFFLLHFISESTLHIWVDFNCFIFFELVDFAFIVIVVAIIFGCLLVSWFIWNVYTSRLTFLTLSYMTRTSEVHCIALH